MPNTQRGTVVSKIKAKTTPVKKASAKWAPKKVEKPTAYENLYAKLEAKKRKLQQEVNKLNAELREPSTNVDKSAQNAGQIEEIAEHNDDPIEFSVDSNVNANSAIAKFQENDCFVEMEEEGVNKEFPIPSEDEQEDSELFEPAVNNNAIVEFKAQGHILDNSSKQTTMQLEQHESEPGAAALNLEQSFALLQSFMIQKRLLSEEELSEFMQSGGKKVPREGTKHKSEQQKKFNWSKKRGSGSSDSEITVYQWAVPISNDRTIVNQFNKTDDKINEFILQVRVESQENQKISTSLEEFMDTSDEYDCFSGAQLGTSADPAYGTTPRKTTEEHALEIICNVEKSKAQMYLVPCKHEVLYIEKIDQDY